MKVPAFLDIGKQANELLWGGKKAGVFQYDNKVVLNAKTSKGVSVIAKAIKKESGIDTDFKATYVHGPWNIDVQPTLQKVSVSAAHYVFDGLKLTLSGGTPKLQTSGKLAIDYAQPYITSKATMTLNKTPLLTVAASTGYQGFVVAGSAILDVTKTNFTRWDVAAAYMGKDFIVTAHSDPGLTKVRGTYWQELDAMSSVAAEVVHEPSSNKVALTMGYSHTSYDGTLSKVKLSNDGTLHLHRDFKTRPDTSLAISLALNALDLSAAPRLGFALDHSP